MLKKLLCTVFLAVFCFGNTAYSISYEAIGTQLESQLRKELSGWIHETIRKECRQARLDMPQRIVISVAGYNGKMCAMSLELSSYVPEKTAKKIAKKMLNSSVSILKRKGWYPEGLAIWVLPCEFGNGINPYDGIEGVHVRGDTRLRIIPREEIIVMLNSMRE